MHPSAIKVLQTDIVFALSATSPNAAKAFRIMKNTIKTLEFSPGGHKLLFSVVVFGTAPSVRLKFSDRFVSREHFERVIDAIPRPTSGADLVKAIDEAARLFQLPGARPKAKKVVVVMIDNKSGINMIDIKEAVASLKAKGIAIVAVAVGNTADIQELAFVTPEINDVINSSLDELPEVLGEKVMKKAMEGKKVFLTFFYHYSIFLKKEIDISFT